MRIITRPPSTAALDCMSHMVLPAPHPPPCSVALAIPEFLHQRSAAQPQHKNALHRSALRSAAVALHGEMR
jgi:hypothetical protein